MDLPRRVSPLLAAHQLNKTYAGTNGQIEALRDVSLSVSSGEFLTIIGPSGCGKSTLFSILAGLAAPSRGHVELAGAGNVALLGRVGYMPQKDLLLPWKTVLDNAALGLEMTGVRRKDARVQALTHFRRFGLAGFERHYPAALSGGMRQRAALLRTVLAGRSILLLDEPFGALDALTRAGMQRWLMELWQDLEKTIVFVTHDVDEAIYLSDRILVMSARPGSIRAELPVSFSRPRDYTEMITSSSFLTIKRRVLSELEL